MGDVISGYRAESGKELDESIDDDKDACSDRNRQEQNEHGYIRKEPSEGEQYAEDGTGSTDGDNDIGIVSHDGSRVVLADERLDMYSPDCFLYGSSSESAEQVVEEELAFTP